MRLTKKKLNRFQKKFINAFLLSQDTTWATEFVEFHALVEKKDIFELLSWVTASLNEHWGVWYV